MFCLTGAHPSTVSSYTYVQHFVAPLYCCYSQLPFCSLCAHSKRGHYLEAHWALSHPPLFHPLVTHRPTNHSYWTFKASPYSSYTQTQYGSTPLLPWQCQPQLNFRRTSPSSSLKRNTPISPLTQRDHPPSGCYTAVLPSTWPWEVHACSGVIAAV